MTTRKMSSTKHNTTTKLELIEEIDKWVKLHSNYILHPEKTRDAVLPSLLETTITYQFKMYNRVVTSNRRSCVYGNSKDNLNQIGYKQTPIFPWNKAPGDIQNIRTRIMKEFGTRIDYVLVHIYRDRHDYIGWHNDKEALNSDIFSLSLGIDRVFQVRDIDATKGFDEEYVLHSGDLVRMIAGTQTRYKHRVPKMKMKELKALIIKNMVEIPKGRLSFKVLDALVEKYNIDTRRINMTFRCFD